MGELEVMLGTPVGEIKLGEKVFTAYKLKLNDFAELERKYSKSLQDILSDDTLLRSVDFILEVLYLSLRKGDATVTREYIGECLDLTSEELQTITQDLFAKILIGTSATNLAQGSPKKQK